MTRVGLVVVSHSERIASGIVDLAGQMAPAVTILAAGGTDDAGIGTSFARVASAMEAADSGAGIVVLCDLGSAIMTAEAARDFMPVERRDRVRIADAPVVEGAVAAAVAAEIGGDLDTVAAAASAAAGVGQQAAPAAPITPVAQESQYARTVTLTNKDGLHARPAAEFVKLAGTFHERVTVNGKDAKSLLGIMSLGLLKGATVELAGAPAAAHAVDALADLIESGFGENGPLPKRDERA
jgi:phosphoenolpyruvate---glycerone phosphotransferase subunit DhaM